MTVVGLWRGAWESFTERQPRVAFNLWMSANAVAPRTAPPQGTWGLRTPNWDIGVKVVMDRRIQLLPSHRRFSGLIPA